METHWYGPHRVKCLFRVISSYHGCSSRLDSFLDDRRKRGDTGQKKERCVLMARTPASSPTDRKSGGALSRVITNTSGRTQIKRERCCLKELLGSCFKVCTCLSSPLMVCTWHSHSVRPWSTRSSRDDHGGNTFAFCEEKIMCYHSKLVCLCVCTCNRVQEGVTCSFGSFSEELVPVFSPS